MEKTRIKAKADEPIESETGDELTVEEATTEAEFAAKQIMENAPQDNSPTGLGEFILEIRNSMEDDFSEPADVSRVEDGLVEVAVEAEDGSGYEIKRVTPEQKLIITAQQMKDRSADRLPSSRFDTRSFSQEFAYYWASPDGANPTTNAILAKGYKPSRQFKPAKALGHQVEDAGGGRGKQIKMGDLTLFEVPRAQAEQMTQEELRDMKLRKAARISQQGSSVEDVLNKYGVNDRRSGIMPEHTYHTEQVENNGFVRDGDFTDLEFDTMQQRANSLAEAMEAARREEEELVRMASGKVSYAGFRGDPKFNKAVPDSPYLRNLEKRSAITKEDLERAARFLNR